MRKFKLTFGRHGETEDNQTLGNAAAWGLNDELDTLADLEVGQTYVDSDGDTWERTE